MANRFDELFIADGFLCRSIVSLPRIAAGKDMSDGGAMLSDIQPGLCAAFFKIDMQWIA